MRSFLGGIIGFSRFVLYVNLFSVGKTCHNASRRRRSVARGHRNYQPAISFRHKRREDQIYCSAIQKQTTSRPGPREAAGFAGPSNTSLMQSKYLIIGLHVHMLLFLQHNSMNLRAKSKSLAMALCAWTFINNSQIIFCWTIGTIFFSSIN